MLSYYPNLTLLNKKKSHEMFFLMNGEKWSTDVTVNINLLIVFTDRKLVYSRWPFCPVQENFEIGTLFWSASNKNALHLYPHGGRHALHTLWYPNVTLLNIITLCTMSLLKNSKTNNFCVCYQHNNNVDSKILKVRGVASITFLNTKQDWWSVFPLGVHIFSVRFHCYFQYFIFVNRGTG